MALTNTKFLENHQRSTHKLSYHQHITITLLHNHFTTSSPSRARSKHYDAGICTEERITQLLGYFLLQGATTANEHASNKRNIPPLLLFFCLEKKLGTFKENRTKGFKEAIDNTNKIRFFVFMKLLKKRRVLYSGTTSKLDERKHL